MIDDGLIHYYDPNSSPDYPRAVCGDEFFVAARNANAITCIECAVIEELCFGDYDAT